MAGNLQSTIKVYEMHIKIQINLVAPIWSMELNLTSINFYLFTLEFWEYSTQSNYEIRDMVILMFPYSSR